MYDLEKRKKISAGCSVVCRRLRSDPGYVVLPATLSYRVRELAFEQMNNALWAKTGHRIKEELFYPLMKKIRLLQTLIEESGGSRHYFRQHQASLRRYLGTSGGRWPSCWSAISTTSRAEARGFWMSSPRRSGYSCGDRCRPALRGFAYPRRNASLTTICRRRWRRLCSPYRTVVPVALARQRTFPSARLAKSMRGICPQ